MLRVISDVLPLSYAVDATHKIAIDASPDIGKELAIVCGFLVLFLALDATTLRRRTP